MMWLMLLGGLVLLVVGAEWLLRGAVDVALRARISPLVVGLTVVSLGTSAPELVVSVLAALKGGGDIALGNVVGSNMVNLGLVLGLCVLIFPVEVDRDAVRIHWPVMMLATVGLLLLIRDGALVLWEGVLFVSLLVTYVWLMIHRSRRAAIPAASGQVAGRAPWLSALLILVGVLGLTFGGDLFVQGASGLARAWGVSEQLIGLTIVAIGTSMPELIASLVAAFRKQPDISLGNLIGSNIFNLLGILGVTACIAPIRVDIDRFGTDLLAMAGIALLLYPLARFTPRLGRWQGAVLLVANLAYLLYVILRG